MDIRDDSVSRIPAPEGHSFSPHVQPPSDLAKRTKTVFNKAIQHQPNVNQTLDIKLGSSLPPLPSRDWLETTELTCRLAKEEKDSLYAILQSLPDVDRKVINLLNAAKTGNWQDPIFNDPNLPYYSLIALHHQQISIEEFVTIQIYLEMVKVYGKESIQIMPIFLSKDGTINPDCSDAMQKTFLSTSFKHTRPIINDQQFAQFKSTLTSLNPLEKVIFIVRDSQIKHDDPTIKDAIYINTGLNLFSRFKNKVGEHKAMTAPVGVVDRFLQIACKNYIKPNFVMGLSTPKQLEATNHRDVMLPFENISCPETADGFPVPDKITFLYHDLNYHCYLAGSVPEKDREKFIKIAQLACTLVSEDNDPIENMLYQELYERFVDMEFPPYRQELSHLFNNNRHKFMESFKSAFVAAYARLEKEDPFIDLAEIEETLPKAMEKVKTAAKHILESPEE